MDIQITINYHAALAHKLQRVDLVFHALLYNVCAGKRQLPPSILEKYCLFRLFLFTLIPLTLWRYVV